jgi:hypothetical protein
MRVLHRVVGIETDGSGAVAFRTMGDANSSPDSTPVPADHVLGVARLVVPYAGLPKAWAVHGQWAHLAVFFAVTIGAVIVSIDTFQRLFSGDGRRNRRRRTAATAVAIAAMLGAPSSAAAFSATTNDVGNQFSMTPQWFLDTVDRDAPIAHWRLGEPPAGPSTTVLTDDFETFSGYNQYGAGSFVTSTAQARSGARSGLKTGNNDPNGGWKLLPAPVTGSFRFEVWVYRPSGYSGGAIDRIGLEDAGFNGYTFRVDHGGNRLGIDRRTGGSAQSIGTIVSFDPPEDAWYRLELVRSGDSMILNAFDGAGTLLGSTTAVDATTNSFDRIVVHGGWDFYVDDLTVTKTDPSLIAVDRIGTLDGSYVGGPALGQPGLVRSDGDTAVDLDGVDDWVLIGDDPAINLSNRPARTTELWFEADTTVGRQVIYEEGGTVNGLNVYLDDDQLFVTAWSQSTGWSNSLVTATTISPNTRYHLAATLDATAARALTLYLDGVPVATDTKADANVWNAHSDDGAIGVLNGGTKFHDGNSSASGSFAFDGTVDEVVLYNSIVPASHLANHYLAGG